MMGTQGYQVTFLGLMNFHHLSSEGGLVLLPNGVRFGGRIPDHFARFFLMKDQVRVRESNWWDPIPNAVMDAAGVLIYPIQAWCDLEISGMEESREPFDMSQFRFIPPLSSLEIVAEEADTIAQLPISSGRLASYRLAESEVATLTVEQHSGPITITARPMDGSPRKHLVLENGAEILLSNMSDLFRGRPDPEGPSHYKIYSKLDRYRRSHGLNEPDLNTGLTPLFPEGSRHPFVIWIREQFGDIPRPGCGVSG